jgi:hypothetical protein
LTHLTAGRQQGVGEGADLLLGLAEQMQGKPLGGAGPDARQPLELIDQAGKGPGEAAQESTANGLNLGGTAPREEDLVQAAPENGRHPLPPPPPWPSIAPR